MNELNYDYENQKEHIDIGIVFYQDSEKEQLFIAKLEMFGNGFDITVYEGEEPQYVHRCVVRNTSYEFLQYTDDNKRVIAKVNGELFIMTEQQFDIIKAYYDPLENSQDMAKTFRPVKSAIGKINGKSAGDYFDEDDELFYVYDEILRDSRNIRLRVKLVFHLMNELQYFERSKTVGDLIKYLYLCEEILNDIVNVKAGKDKKLLFVKLLSMSQLGFVYAFRGELDEAVKIWYQALELIQESSIKSSFDIKRFIGANALNILCTLKYLKEDAKIMKINARYKDYIHDFCTNKISVKKKMLDDNPVGTNHHEYAIDQLNRVSNLEKMLDHFVLIEYSDDDLDSIYVSNEDPDYDDYAFSYSTLKSIEEDFQNGTYKPIFEKDDSERRKQVLRLRAFI